jgi:adenine phosphoribosyltransferase
VAPGEPAAAAMDLRAFIRDIPDFPEPGIVFKDATPLLLNPAALDAAVAGLAEPARELGVDYVVGAEARGFILGAALARELGAGFVPARRPGKLPHQTVSAEYALEYGVNALEVHSDALGRGGRVLVHDDLLATGGTAAALCELVEGLGASVVLCSFLIELSFLDGRQRLDPRPVSALIGYPG